MHDLTAKIREVDLSGVVRDAGVELHSRHGRMVGLCPFHPEKTPSFFIFPDNRFQCFSCHEHGDAVDFLQRLHGIDFKASLNHLGINQGRLTVADRKAISEAKRKQKRRQVRGKRETELAYTLGTLIRWAHLAMRALTPDNLHIYGGILDPLAWYTWGHDVLVTGDKLERAYVLWSFKGFPAIERGLLFDENFDYDTWVSHSFPPLSDRKIPKIVNSASRYNARNGASKNEKKRTRISFS
jgi:hypothetical protein